MSAEEWQTRIDLAACYRLMAVYSMTDLIYNHISARIAGRDEHYLINPYGMLYEEITASSLVKIDVEGETILQSDHGCNVIDNTVVCFQGTEITLINESRTNPTLNAQARSNSGVYGGQEWAALLRKLDRMDDSYRH